MQNRTCASREEQDKYFATNILSLMINQQEPTLHSEVNVVRKVNQDAYYTVKTNEFTEYNDFWIERNSISLEDDLTGILDNSVNVDIIQYKKGLRA